MDPGVQIQVFLGRALDPRETTRIRRVQTELHRFRVFQQNAAHANFKKRIFEAFSGNYRYLWSSEL